MKFKFFSYQPNNILNKITPIYSDIDSDSDYINEFGQNEQNNIKYIKLEDILPLIFNESNEDKNDEESYDLLYRKMILNRMKKNYYLELIIKNQFN